MNTNSLNRQGLSPGPPAVGQGRKVLIVGAGPAGLTAAAELLRPGYEITVLEQDECYVGGLSRTVRYKGVYFDVGGHRFFSKNIEITRWWQNRLPSDFMTVKRLSRILYRQKFYDYPLRPLNALMNLGLLTSASCLLSYVWARLRPIKPERTFDEWVANRFGRQLFNIFFKTYTEKVWGVSCRGISADWASQRIKDLSLAKAILRACRGPRRDSKIITTLIEEFQYPRRGPGMMWEKTRDDLIQGGVRVAMGQKVEEIHTEGERVAFVRSRTLRDQMEDWPADEFIVSMPLRDCVLSMRPRLPEVVEAAARTLQYRDIITVALIIEGSSPFPDNWIYVHDPSVRVGRVQNFNNWSLGMVPRAGVTCLGLEYFCTMGDTLWSLSDAELIELGSRELDNIGLVRGRKVLDGCVARMEKAYPVYHPTYQADVSIIRAALARFKNLQPVGRNGMHKYNNQDHSMMTALLAARNLMGDYHDPWKVNADAEYHETASSAMSAGRMAPSVG